jgi:hypothetical protein
LHSSSTVELNGTIISVVWFMAVVHCHLCVFKHPRPVGNRCVFRTWLIERDEMDEQLLQERETQQVLQQPLLPQPPILPPVPNDIEVIAAPIPREEPQPQIDPDEILNSTTRSHDRSHRSRGSNRSRLSASDEVLLEIRDMNRNIAMMLCEAKEDRERMKRIENRINVNDIPINTSIGVSILPHVHYTNSYPVCFTQVQPTYATANSYTHGRYGDKSNRRANHTAIRTGTVPAFPSSN